jgi:hypothetical protein
MAEVKFSSPVCGLRGTFSKESGVYYKMVNGRTFVCRKGVTRKAKVTAEQKTYMEKFRSAAAMCNEIMRTEELRKMYQKKWRSQSKYKTLRGYVFAVMYRGI